MKNLMVPCLITILFTSCSKEDYDIAPDLPADSTVCVCSPNVDRTSLYGEWSSISYPSDEPLYDINNDGINSSDLLEELPCRYSKFTLNPDLTFVHESNTWEYDSTNKEYACASGNDLTIITGTWKANLENTLLSLSIGPNISFLYIEFDGKTLKHQVPELFHLNAQGESQGMLGKVIFCRK